MATLTWQGRTIACGDESVLDALAREGVTVPSSCRAGACQSCLVRAVAGTAPSSAQKGLRASLVEQGFFLACQAKLTDDLTAAPADDLPVTRAAVLRVERAADDVARVFLRTDGAFEARGGQFVHVLRDDGLTRPYSLANRSGDGALELHVRRVAGGAMSPWLCDLAAGATLRLRGPSGECVYRRDRPAQPLVLAGTGTGLAPLLGVLRDALDAGHGAPITLVHGARTLAGLYEDDALRAMAARHPMVRYEPAVLDAPEGDLRRGDFRARVAAVVKATKGARVHLCGPPETLRPVQRDTFLAGVPLGDIAADLFVTAPSR